MRAEIRFLSVEHVVRMHAELLQRYGGTALPSHRGEEEGIAAAVLAVINSYYDDVFDLASAYAVYIVMGHVFGDGNKRTGAAAALTFLAVNDVRVDAKPGDLRDVMIDLQRRAETSPPPAATDLVRWLSDWLRARQRSRRAPARSRRS